MDGTDDKVTESLRIAREREAATREILEVISQSRDDEQPVFQAIHASASRLCDAPFSGLFLVDESGMNLDLVSHFGGNPAYVEASKVKWPLNKPAAVTNAVVRRDVVHIHDVMKTDAYRDGDEATLKAVELEGTRTFLAVPLLTADRAIGTIGLYRREVRPFTDEQIAILQTFAAQAVIAIENVRQFRELQTRLEREKASREILQVISRSRDDEQPVFDVILRKASQLCSSTSAGLVLGRKGDKGQTLAAHLNSHPEIPELYADGKYPMDPDLSNAARAIIEGRVIHLEDMKESDAYRKNYLQTRRMVDHHGVRTNLLVPLLSTDGGIGALILYKQEVSPYTPDQIALVETFAAQAVIAIENVRQFRELQTRLEREAATREILDVVSRSRDDENPVFNTILENACRLCEAQSAFVIVRDESGEFVYSPAQVGATEEFASVFTEWRAPYATSPLGAVVSMREQRVIAFDDLADTDLYRSGNPDRVRQVDLEGVRSLVNVPLLSGDEAVGAMILYRREVRPFSDDNIALVEAFAAQAVIAIENVRQFRELETRLEREKASAQILEVISQSRDDATPVFEALLKAAVRICGASNGALTLGEEDGGPQVLGAHVDAPEEMVARYRAGGFAMDKDVSLGARAIIDRETLYYPDVADGEPFRKGMAVARWLVEDGIRTSIYVPLISGGKGIGCLNLHHRVPRTYADDDIALLETFAAQAVIAIENVRQFRELQARLKRETATSEVLGVISRSRDDENPVFDTILQCASRLCDAPLAMFGVVDETRDRVFVQASVGTNADYIEELNKEGLPLDDTRQVVASAIRTGEAVHVLDMLNSDLYREGNRVRALSVEMEGIRTFLAAPIMSGAKGLGVIVVFRREVRAFSDDQISLLESFAAQAAIAIENARQFRELQTRLEREAATGEVLSVISRSRDDEKPVFDVILENAARLCRAPHAFLQLRNTVDTHLIVAAQNFATSKFLDLLRENPIPTRNNPGSISVLGMNASTPTQYEDIRLLRGTELYTPQLGYAMDTEGMRTGLFVPLTLNGEGIGVIVLYKHEVAPFTDDEIALVQTFAAQAVIAIENVEQFRALEATTKEVQALNASLEDRVQEQVGEIERMGKLKSFLPAAVADTVVSQGADKMLKSHRALLGVLFCDIRGFTAFCETAEPEETIEVLQTYHEEMGKLIVEHGAGVDHRMGDGIMVLFNDPVPCEHPAGAALALAMAMRDRMAELCKIWKRLGHRLGFGVGISLGYATVGMIGYEGRYDYTASGSAVNLAARLSDRAEDGEILLSPRAYTAVEDECVCEPAGKLDLKGLSAPVEVMKAIAMIADANAGS